MAIKGVIFDLGMTLLRYGGDDPAADARMQADLAAHLERAGAAPDREAFRAAFAARLAEFHAQRLRDWVEVTAANVLASALADLGLPPLSAEQTAAALKAYFAHAETLWEVTPGVAEVLPGLARRGCRLAVISNTVDEAHMLRLMERAGLRRWFDPIVLSAAVGVRKPNPRIFELVLEPWGLPRSEVAMVGDTLGSDVLGAQLAGIHSVWLASRSATPANEAHQHTIRADAVIHSLLDLPGALDALASRPPGARPA
jgi:HAD superfamily hydrolase (TIGR01549 family)